MEDNNPYNETLLDHNNSLLGQGAGGQGLAVVQGVPVAFGGHQESKCPSSSGGSSPKSHSKSSENRNKKRRSVEGGEEKSSPSDKRARHGVDNTFRLSGHQELRMSSSGSATVFPAAYGQQRQSHQYMQNVAPQPSLPRAPTSPHRDATSPALALPQSLMPVYNGSSSAGAGSGFNTMPGEQRSWEWQQLQQQQRQNQSLHLQQSFQELQQQQQQGQGLNHSFGGNNMGMGSSSQHLLLQQQLMQQQQLQQQQQQQASWLPSNAELMFRSTTGSGANSLGLSSFLPNGHDNSSNMMMMNNSASAEELMNLQVLRQQQQQQERIRQLEQQAAMRQQLSMLQGNSGGGHGGNHQNPINMNQMGLTMMMNGGMGAGMPNNCFNGAAAVQSSSSNISDGLALQESVLLEHQHQQQNSNTNLRLQIQEQQQHGTQPELLQQLLRQQHLQQHQMCASSSPGGCSPSRQAARSPAASPRHSMGGNSNNKGLKPSALSSPPANINLARAKPIKGPLAPPVPAPPAHLLCGQTSYQLPPIEDGEEIPHFDVRAHVPLAIEEDQNWLSEFQCFVRAELLQVFRASHKDVKIRVASKKVSYKQVGIRCRFCAHCKPSSRAIRSSAFPSSIRQLYQSFTMMLRDHFGSCDAIPEPLKERFLELKRNNTQGASDSMRYWVYSAVKLGMVDSECGIVLNEQTQAAARDKPPFGTTSSMMSDEGTGGAMPRDQPARLLVKADDMENKLITSEFLYTLLTQYQLIRLLPTECIGNRKSLRPNVPGLGCRYCCHAGRLGLARVFPAKKKQLPAQMQDLYDHIRRCNLCPDEVKEELEHLKDGRGRRKSDTSDVAQGREQRRQRIVDDGDKGFLDLLWQRLGHKGELATPAAAQD